MSNQIELLQSQINDLDKENKYLKKVIDDLNLKIQELQTSHVGTTEQEFNIEIDAESANKYVTGDLIVGNDTNTLSFVVKDKEGKMLGNVVTVLKRENGLPVQASKSNAFGQVNFNSAQIGEYFISLEREGYKFPKVKVKLEGKNIPIFEIRAI